VRSRESSSLATFQMLALPCVLGGVYRSFCFKTLSTVEAVDQQREEFYPVCRIEFEGATKDLFEFDSHDRNRSIL
jgi:hypothetical protein